MMSLESFGFALLDLLDLALLAPALQRRLLFLEHRLRRRVVWGAAATLQVRKQVSKQCQ